VQGVSASEGSNDETASLGKIVTLMSVDAAKLQLWLSYSHDLLVNLPVSIVTAISSLFFILGPSSFVGVGIIILLIPVSSYLGKLIVRFTNRILEATDARIAIMNEILQGIRIVKYFAWEKHFAAKIEVARKKELDAIVSQWGAWLGFATLGNGGGIIIACATFFVYTVVAGNRLDVATAFTGIQLLRVVSVLLATLPRQVMSLFTAKVWLLVTNP
jgi:ABC-type multidrug transport system fused ATPase/permease subunit